jgi:hypothetical protein
VLALHDEAVKLPWLVDRAKGDALIDAQICASPATPPLFRKVLADLITLAQPVF